MTALSTSLFDRLLHFISPETEAAPAPPPPPPTAAELLALTALPEAGAGAWFLLADRFEIEDEHPPTSR